MTKDIMRLNILISFTTILIVNGMLHTISDFITLPIMLILSTAGLEFMVRFLTTKEVDHDRTAKFVLFLCCIFFFFCSIGIIYLIFDLSNEPFFKLHEGLALDTTTLKN